MSRLAALLTLLLFVIMLSSVTPVFAAANPFDHRLPFKTATISSTISGSENGTETLYVADYGRKRARLCETAGKILFVTTKTHTLEITDPDWQINIDLAEKTGTKAISMHKLLKQEYERLSAAEQKVVRANIAKMGANAGAGGQQQIEYKAAKHLGRACDVVTIAGMTTYVLAGTDIVVKSDMETMGVKSHTVATSIDTKSGVGGDRFVVPAGIEVTHDPAMDEQNRQGARASINYLKDPQAAEKSRADYEEGTRAMEESGYQSGPKQTKEEDGSGATGDAVQQGLDALKGLFK
ncbi:hypothetical protein ACFL5J_00815 [Thermodesulfobacteriota bacterium]